MNKDYKLKHSYLTGRNYDVLNTVKILNMKQCAFYIENNLFPTDISVSYDKNNKKCLVFYFDRDESRELYDRWCNYDT